MSKNVINNHLYIGGVSAFDLVKTYHTPLYVMDESKIRSQCQMFKKHFNSDHIETETIYASKAFLSLAMCELVDSEGLSLDVVSGGELYTAHQAGFPMHKIYFHGNNKSLEELKLAIEYQVGTIVVDHRHELLTLVNLIPKNQKINVMLRVNPGIEAHTHEYIRTTHHDSKFGLSIYDESTLDLIKEINQYKSLVFRGFHSHIGSQIFEEQSFIEHAQTVLTYISDVFLKTGIVVEEMNLGGGFGAKYTAEDKPFDLESFLPTLLERIGETSKKLRIKVPKVFIEPGRSIVAEAGYTLYTVGGTKKTTSGKQYVFIDGSMADHMRTALYQAKYDAVIANKLNDEANTSYTVAGKACESGDIIIKDVKLPKPEVNDILAVKTTGAYHYSMSSNYNRLTRPAVVFVKDGKSKLIVQRETYQDLIRNDLKLED